MSLSVAITTNTLTAGGAERQRVALATELAARGHRVTLYCLQAFGPLREQLGTDVRVELRDYRRGPRPGHDVLLTGTTNTETAFALLGKARARGRLRWLAAVHNPIGDGAPPLATFARTAVVRADGVAALSRWHADQLRQRWGLGCDVVLGNGIDPEPAAAIARARTAGSFRYDIGFLGRLSIEHKGLDTLLDALAEPAAADLRLAVAGTGPDADRLRQHAARLALDDRITWLGYQRPEEFLPQVRTLALLSRYEGQPMVALEAAAAGVPIVATATAGLAAGPATRIVASRSPSDVAQALTASAADLLPPPTPVRTVAQMTDDYLAAFESLLASDGTVLHVGNDPTGSGGIASVLRGHLRRDLPGMRVRNVPSYRQDATTPWRRNAPALAAAGALLRRRSVVHVHLSQGGSLLREGALALLAARRGSPVVLTLHGSRLLDGGPIAHRLLRLVLHRATVVHGFADDYRRRLAVPAEKWRCIPNDVDVPSKQPDPADKEPVVLFAGEVGHRKGVDVLLDAWSRLPSTGWTLTIAGPPTAEIQPVLDRHRQRQNVTVRGPLDHARTLAEMDRAAVLVQPSRAETFPMAVCEAMARGCAVVGTDVGALGGLLTDAGQVAVPPADADALAAGLLDAMSAAHRRVDRARAARAYAETRLATPVVTQAWAALYRQLDPSGSSFCESRKVATRGDRAH